MCCRQCSITVCCRCCRKLWEAQLMLSCGAPWVGDAWIDPSSAATFKAPVMRAAGMGARDAGGLCVLGMLSCATTNDPATRRSHVQQ